jgi:uncharacterized membrane protein YeaQ/YmgE (transglycosylase-associated protein family)
MIPADFIAEQFAQLRKDIARFALIPMVGGACIVIAWIEVFRRVCL